MNWFGVGMLLTVALFVALAFAFRWANRRAEKTGIASAQRFVNGAVIARTGMYALQHPESQLVGNPDQEVLPPLPRREERRERSKPEFPYSYRQGNISQQLTREIED